MITTKVFRMVGYKCYTCGRIFDAVNEYVIAMDHGTSLKHDVKGLYEEQSYDEFEEQQQIRVRKFFAEQRNIGGDVSQNQLPPTEDSPILDI